MSGLTVVTPSYGPDLQLFLELHASLLRHGGSDVEHLVVVPDLDYADFAAHASDRLIVRRAGDFLPGDVVSIARLTRRLPPRLRRMQAVRLRRPVRPISGWIVQQAVKLAVVASLDSDLVLLADSDAVVIKDIEPSTFVVDGVVPVYRKPGAVTGERPAQARWLKRAYELLGHPELYRLPGDDYIGGFLPWSPSLVRDALAQVESVTRRSWLDAVLASENFSECMLYGAFASIVYRERPEVFTEDSRCATFWERWALDGPVADRFLAGVKPTDLAVLIQSSSRTTPAMRQQLLEQIRPTS